MNDKSKTTKEDVIKKIKEILAKDKRFNDVDVEVIFKQKSRRYFYNVCLR